MVRTWTERRPSGRRKRKLKEKDILTATYYRKPIVRMLNNTHCFTATICLESNRKIRREAHRFDYALVLLTKALQRT